MARTTSQPSTATRRNSRTTRPDTNGVGSLDEQDQRDEDNQPGDNDERRDGLSAVREEQNNDRRSSRDERGNGRDERGFGESRDGDERENANGRDERNEGGEYNEEGARREQPAALAAGMDTFAPVLEAWKQVFTSWSELTETMVKAQQDTFASMISAANAHAKDLNLGENRNGEHALSGSRTVASTPERIDRDRR